MALINGKEVALPQIQPEASQPLPEAKPKELVVPKPLLDVMKSRQASDLPADIGKKILHNGLHQGQTIIQKQPKLVLTPKYREDLTRSYQGLLREPLFNQKKDFGLVRSFVERRYTDLSRGERAPASSRIPLDVLKSLFKVRHQVADRPSLLLVLRYELANRRQQKQVNETKERQRTKAEQNPTLEKEAFLKRYSHALKDLKPSGDESVFEALLKRALTGQEMTAQVNQGRKGNFRGKSEAAWNEFFANILKQGSKEGSVTHKADQIMEAFYRGLYKNISSQNSLTLVTDLKLSTGEKELTEKFARIVIDNPLLMEKLAQLKPGDDLPKELLALLGEDIEFTRLMNKVEVLGAQTGEQLLQQLRQNANPHSLSRLEQQIIQERKRQALEDKGTPLLLDDTEEEGLPSFFPGRQDDELNKRRFLGLPKLGVGLVYTASFFVLLLVLYSMLKAWF